MADSTFAVSFTRTDRKDPLVDAVSIIEDAGSFEGPGRVSIPAGSGSTEYTLWTGINNGNGSAFTAVGYDRIIGVVDPDNLLAEDDPDGDIGLWITPYYTAIAGGSATALQSFFHRRKNGAFSIPSSIAASGVTITREITKVTAKNANTGNDVVVLLVVEV